MGSLGRSGSSGNARLRQVTPLCGRWRTTQAQQIVKDIQAMDTATAEKNILSSEYANLSWAVLNLNLWAQFTHDATMQALWTPRRPTG